MKILVLGSGGREHALVHAFARQGHEVFCLPGNTGTKELCMPVPAINVNDFAQLINFVKSYGMDLTLAGPENFLAEGMADAFAKQGLPFFGPTQKAARLESSKAWAKRFMHRHHIPTARFAVCSSINEAYTTAKMCFLLWKKGVVVKPSGLTGGKGVTICHHLDEARKAIKSILEDKIYGEAGHQIILEQRLEGEELSLLAFCNGKQIIPMVPAQDHKRLYDNNLGPNTGGLGAYAPASFVSSNDLDVIREKIIEKTQHGLNKDHVDYRGVLYFGLMLTEQGPKVLEFNCRFGDPEAQVILPLLKTDLAEIMFSCIGNDTHLKDNSIQWFSKSACCVVMASGGYPNDYKMGYPIHGLEEVKKIPDCFVYHAGTTQDLHGNVVTAGGRVLGVTGLGASIEEAAQKAYLGVEKIQFTGSHHRKDIAGSAHHMESKM